MQFVREVASFTKFKENLYFIVEYNFFIWYNYGSINFNNFDYNNIKVLKFNITIINNIIKN